MMSVVLATELSYADIQALSNADAAATFFERLGYGTGVRRIQRQQTWHHRNPQ